MAADDQAQDQEGRLLALGVGKLREAIVQGQLDQVEADGADPLDDAAADDQGDDDEQLVEEDSTDQSLTPEPLWVPKAASPADQ